MKNFVLENQGDLWYGVFPKLQEYNIKHAISTKILGESDLFGQALNISFNVNDSPEKVYRNREKITKAIGIDCASIIATQQVHSTNVLRVDKTYLGRGSKDFSSAVEATDALITNEPGVPLLVFVADCVPLIIFDPTKRAIGVVHAGWRGTVQRIAVKTILKMQEEFATCPEDCLVFIGPSIGPCCYEVDMLVEQVVRHEFEFAEQISKPTRVGHWQLDLWLANSLQLQEMGLPKRQIFSSKVCTVDNNNLFFSHRAEQGFTGRMGVFVSL